MKAQLFVFFKLAAALLVALFAIDSLITHFRDYTYLLPNDVSKSQAQRSHNTPSSDTNTNNDSQAPDVPQTENNQVTTTVISAMAAMVTKVETTAVPTTVSGVLPDFTTTTWTSTDREGEQILHFVLERSKSNHDFASDSLLALAITRDNESFGRNPTEEPRTIHNFLDFVTNTTLAPQGVSLAILTASPSEFELYQKILTPHSDDGHSTSKYFDYEFRRVTLVLHPGGTRAPKSFQAMKTAGKGGNRGDRHGIPQHERRATLAKLRNYLQFVALRDETHLLWLDSDVYKFSSDKMVEAMMKQTRITKDADAGIVTARCRMGEPEIAEQWMKEHPDFKLPNPPKDGEEEDERRGKEGGEYEVMAWKLRALGHYDLNAWKGQRTGPNNVEQEALWKDLATWEPHNAPGMKILDDVIEKLDGNQLGQLDSVGGTVLMLRADLVRMGLNFATGYTVGMTFEHGEGYDGIETEGICLMSRSMSRDGQSMCYSMGGSWSVWHTIF